MLANSLPILCVLLVLLAWVAVARHLSATVKRRNTLSVVLVVLGLLTAFFLFFSAGSWFRSHRAQPRPHASVSSHGRSALPLAACSTAEVIVVAGSVLLARPARIERATPGFGGQYSIH